MVQVPVFENEVTVRAPGAAHADPGAFAAPGRALAAGAAEFGAQEAAFNERYLAAKRQADAANVVAGVSRQLDDAEFRWGQTPDRQAAQAGFDKEAADLRAATLKSIKDPLISGYVSERFDAEAVARSRSAANNAFQLEASKRRGDLDTITQSAANAAATTRDPVIRALQLDNAKSAIEGAAAAGWIAPEAAAKMQLKFRSDVEEAYVKRSLNAAFASPDLDQSADAAAQVAHAVSDPSNYPELNPERREALASQALIMADHQSRRAAAAAMRADAQSDKALKRMQAFNAAQAVMQARTGQLDEQKLPGLVMSGQLSESGYAAAIAALDREEKGRDDPYTAGTLRAAVEGGHAGADEINDAFAHGKISSTTHAAMMTKWGEHDRQQQNEVEKGAYQTLKTLTSGAAVEQGIIKDDGLRARAEQIWGQAQGEWNRRVLAGHEDPIAVLSDLAPKYAMAMPQRPTWLSPPKFGGVNSMDDVKRVYAATKASRESGALDDAAFRSQAQLLENYRAFYAEKDQRDAAATNIPFAKPGQAAQKKGAAK